MGWAKAIATSGKTRLSRALTQGRRAYNGGKCTADRRDTCDALSSTAESGFRGTSNLEILAMQWVARRACQLRRKSCISICVHNAERLSRLMKVEHARAIAITRKGCVKRAHRRNPARTKLSSRFAESDFEPRKHRTTVSSAMRQSANSCRASSLFASC
jgi:hypothetical protein